MRGDTIHLFWSKYDSALDTSFETWFTREISLNPSHSLSLQAHIKQGHNIQLYTYQPIPQGLPDQVTVHDADLIYPANLAWAALCRGHSIAHISDLVRLRAASQQTGVVLDMDAIVINELPNVDGFFCTMPAKAEGGVAPKWGTAHPPFTVHDGTWDGKALSAFPIKVNKAMAPHISGLATWIETTLANLPKNNSKAWNYVLWTIKEMSREFPNCKIYPPIKGCPVPSWMPPGKCYSIESPTRLDGLNKIFGYQLPAINEILTESFIVQHFFESAFQKTHQSLTPATFWYEIPANSLIGIIAQQIVGDRWRTILPTLARI
jgi:hypothetical protein